MTVLIDSWAWIEYFQGSDAGKSVNGYLECGDRIIISSLNVAEVFRQILAKRSKKDAVEALEYMLGVSFVFPVTTDIAVEAAIIRHEKKWRLGDSIVMATAKSQNARLLTGDSDFRSEKDVLFIG